MSSNDAENDAEGTVGKPRRSRVSKSDRRVYVYRMANGKPKEQGSFPEAVIGEPLERRLLPFLQEMNFSPGDYKIEIRKSNGHFEKSFEYSLADPEPQREEVIDIEPEDFDVESEPPLVFREQENDGQRNAAEVENIFLKERLKRLEEDIARQRTGNQSEMQTLISALEESRREQRELMLMMLNRSQQPQQDATAQAMNILERSLGIVTKAKAISEEIAPHESSSGGGLLADGAKLIDSLGRNAGTFLPMIMGAGIGARPPSTPPRPQPANTPIQKTDSNGQLAELAKRIQQKGETKE